MTSSTFRIAFEGAALDDGEIDVRDLAPALLALGDVVQAANRALNGDRAQASLKMKATSKGSFEALLSIDVSILTALGDLLDVVTANPDRMTAADTLMELLLKAGGVTAAAVTGLFGALKFLRGKRPEKVEARPDGTVVIVHNHNSIIVDPRTVALLNDAPTRQAVEKFSERALASPQIEGIRIADVSGSDPLILGPEDRTAMQVPAQSQDEELLASTTRDVWLKIVTSAFRDGYKWRFSDGGEKPFSADVEDVDFVNAVLEGKIALSANDTLLCSISEEQRTGPNGLSKEIKVLRVLKHEPGAKQLRFL